MSLLTRIFGGAEKKPPAPAQPTFDQRMSAIVQAYGEYFTLDDDGLWKFLRDGRVSSSGISVSEDKALTNPAVYRSVALISQTIGMLPFHMIDKNTKEKAVDHPLFPILHRRPNDFQTAYDFRTMMQLRVLVKGNAYARIIRGASSKKVMRLIPLNPDHIEPKFTPDWSVVYEYRPGNGPSQRFSSSEILHLRNGLSKCGLKGISLIEIALNTIGLALSAELAAARLMKYGSFVTGWIEVPSELGDVPFERLRNGWDSNYSGADNAGRTPILEQGAAYKTPALNARDAQHNELRSRLVEDIGRVFGVPRPLLMVDDTSWGSGIEVLGEHFVRFGLNPSFESWQQACELALLLASEVDQYELKFNAGALTRGSLKDQGEFFAKALGSGGGRPFMTQNEVRAMFDMPADPDGGKLNPDPPPADPRDGIGGNGGPPLDD